MYKSEFVDLMSGKNNHGKTAWNISVPVVLSSGGLSSALIVTSDS
jgi:hypothetical protein